MRAVCSLFLDLQPQDSGKDTDFFIIKKCEY